MLRYWQTWKQTICFTQKLVLPKLIYPTNAPKLSYELQFVWKYTNFLESWRKKPGIIAPQKLWNRHNTQFSKELLWNFVYILPEQLKVYTNIVCTLIPFSISGYWLLPRPIHINCNLPIIKELFKAVTLLWSVTN